MADLWENLTKVNWEKMFVPSTPLLEILVRGTLVYLALLLLLRLVLKRQSGSVSVTDLLVVVLIADAAQNSLADDYRSIPEGILLVSVIIFWSYIVDKLGYWFPLVERLVHPPPLLLVKNGKMLRQNMRKELVTVDELMSHMREQGIDTLKQVKRAYMEGDGRISIVRHDRETTGNDRQRDPS
ncbi:MAG: DUF421 domain-containing protein [Chloroflexaceae bacterium]|nr:DUF421 domain-containing protein [Chloroflexaceae bacterium]